MRPDPQGEGPRHVGVEPDVSIRWMTPSPISPLNALQVGVVDPHDEDRRYWVVFNGTTHKWALILPGFRLGVRVESLSPGHIVPRISFKGWADIPPGVLMILRDLTPTLQALIDVREGEEV